MSKPSSVDDFLLWTDLSVEQALEAAAGRGGVLLDLRRHLSNGTLMVAEVEGLGESLPFRIIDGRVAALKVTQFPKAVLWMILSSELEPVSIYRAGSILVQHRGRFQTLDSFAPSVSNESSV